jgi:hypothetical protein
MNSKSVTRTLKQNPSFSKPTKINEIRGNGLFTIVYYCSIQLTTVSNTVISVLVSVVNCLNSLIQNSCKMSGG